MPRSPRLIRLPRRPNRKRHSPPPSQQRVETGRPLSDGADASLNRKGWWHRWLEQHDAIGALDRMITTAILAGVAVCIWMVILWCAWHIVPRLFGF